VALSGPGDEGGLEEVGGVFSDINITPLTDIFLVLLIIFMVGAAMAVDAASTSKADPGKGESGVQVDLPRGAARDLDPTSSDVVVAILADGRVVLSGKEVRDDELQARLTEARGKTPGATLILQADEGVVHGRVVSVMEKARAAGFEKLAVATRGD
jgi:biopolymer transport protein ExbD